MTKRNWIVVLGLAAALMGAAPPNEGGASFVLNEGGSSIVIDETGILSAAKAGTSFKATKITFGGGTTRVDSVSIEPKAGLSGVFHQKNLEVRINEAAAKYESKADGYRLFIDNGAGFRVTVSNDSVVELAISPQGVAFAEENQLGIAISEQAPLARKVRAARKARLNLTATSDGEFNFSDHQKLDSLLNLIR